MVTRSTSNQLSKRIDEIADRLGATVKPMYTVYLDFSARAMKSSLAKILTLGRRRDGAVLSFGTGDEKFVRIPRPEQMQKAGGATVRYRGKPHTPTPIGPAVAAFSQRPTVWRRLESRMPFFCESLLWIPGCASMTSLLHKFEEVCQFSI